MAATLVIATSLSPAECELRIRALIDPVVYRLRPDPARPLKGSASLDGFDVRPVTTWDKSPLVRAVGSYRSDGIATRVEVHFGLPLQHLLLPIVLGSVIFGALFGLVFPAVVLRRIELPSAAAFFTAAALLAVFWFVVQTAMLWFLAARHADEQQARLTSLLREALAGAARE